jgi:restriction system protein
VAKRSSAASRAAHRQREHEQRARRLEREQRTRAREAERALKAYERSQALAEKERKQLYLEARIAEMEAQNEQLASVEQALETLLTSTLDVDDYVDLESLREEPLLPEFQPGALEVSEPAPELTDFLPSEPSGLAKFKPGAGKKHAREVEAATERYEAERASHQEREQERVDALEKARREHEVLIADIRSKTDARNRELDDFQARLAAADPDAVVDYFSLVLDKSSYPSEFPKKFKIAFVPESKQLVVEYELPPAAVVPQARAFKYIKARDAIDASPRPATQSRTLYASVVAQMAVRTLHELFEADRGEKLETLVFNGYVDTIDPATGRPITPHLVTVRVSREAFLELDLRNVEPLACLKGLNASVSRNPADLTPVRPVLDFNMVDPRFVQESDVLSTLDTRPNLMELTPSEFESLITNLFEKMGLETRQTQASRDGGVDCVAYDARPILGGKVVIQAKRYKNTVGVSAVRDLFGTMQNEGASKGILVTTSGYGKSSFNFADGKPLELLSGTNLLYLLAEHAGIEARIQAPEDWVDPAADAYSSEPRVEPAVDQAHPSATSVRQ